MRRVVLFFLVLPLAVSAFAQSPAPRWPVSAAIANGRLEVSWDRCPKGTREWEAFLSLDGGRSFPIRVTPHLSASIRSFSWPLPRLVSDDARLRIRFGDGASELEYDLESGFPLRPAAGASPLTPATRDLGERPARGEERTAAWVEGSGDLPRTVAPIGPSGFRPSSLWRGASFAETILPARRYASLRPFDAPIQRPRSIERTIVRAIPRDAPSLSRLSRLNV